MYKGRPFANKILERIEQSRLLQNHRNNIAVVRPGTELAEARQTFVSLNPKKKQMQQQSKYTEIERQNRLLLEKITKIMNKKRSNSQSEVRSLNSSLRRKQFQSIQVQNAKMLKRLQQKKSDYELHTFKKQWRKTKKMIKSITSYPIVIDNINSTRKKKPTIQIDELKRIANNVGEQFQIVKVRLINTKKFVVTIKFTKAKFIIIGDLKSQKELKIIEIDKEEALKFIEQNCDGDIHKLFDFLRYDQTEKSLYLVSDAFEKCNEGEGKDQNRIKLRQKRQMSHKPIYEGVDYNILDREDLIF